MDFVALLEKLDFYPNVEEEISPVIKTVKGISKLLINVQTSPVSVFDLKNVRNLFENWAQDYNFDVLGGDGGELISRQSIYDILNDENITNLLQRCVNILFTYIANYLKSYEHHYNDAFMKIIVEAVDECYRTLKLCKCFDTKQVCQEIQTFLQYLVDVLANIDVSNYKDKYSLTSKFIIMLASTEDVRAHVLDLIFFKLTRVHRFLIACKNRNSLDACVIDGISHYTTITKTLQTVMDSSVASSSDEKSGAKKFLPLFKNLRPHLPAYLQTEIIQCARLIESHRIVPGDEK